MIIMMKIEEEMTTSMKTPRLLTIHTMMTSISMTRKKKEKASTKTTFPTWKTKTTFQTWKTLMKKNLKKKKTSALMITWTKSKAQTSILLCTKLPDVQVILDQKTGQQSRRFLGTSRAPQHLVSPSPKRPTSRCLA